jgi:tetratricopeptide (TPR) repeat protein
MNMKIGFQKHGVWALVGATVFLTACGDRAASYLENARRLERDYNYEEAARQYELVTVAFKRAPEAEPARVGVDRCRAAMHFDKAEELIFAGAAWTALPEIEAGRRMNPDDPRGLYLAGLAHLGLGPVDVASQEFTACVMRHPASPYGYLGRGEYYRFTLKRDLAFDEYVRAYRAAGSDVRARGAAFRGLRDMALKLEKGEGPATSYYQEGLALTDEAALAYWIGFYYLRKEPIVFEKATEYFARAVAAPGTGLYETRAYAGLAECYYFYKDFTRAREYIDYALGADPANDQYYKIAWRVYKKLNLPPPQKIQK